MNLDPAKLELGRTALESLLNQEVGLTAQERAFEVELLREQAVEQALQFTEESEREKERAEVLASCTTQEKEESLKNDGALIYVRSSQPYFVGQGQHQGILNIGNGLVAVGGIYQRKKVIPKMFDRFPNIYSFACGDYSYSQETLETISSLLKDTGIEIRKPVFLHVGWDPSNLSQVKVSLQVNHRTHQAQKPDSGQTESLPEDNYDPNVFISQDLTEGGKYRISDYSKEDVACLTNAQKINEQIDTASQILMECHFDGRGGAKRTNFSKPALYAIIPHNQDYNPKTAILHLFYVLEPRQADSSNGKVGRLILGDFDHVMAWP